MMIDGQHSLQTVTIDGQVYTLAVGVIGEYQSYSVFFCKGVPAKEATDVIAAMAFNGGDLTMQTLPAAVAKALPQFNAQLVAHFGGVATVPTTFSDAIESWLNALRITVTNGVPQVA